MRIYKPKGITRGQIVLVTTLGIFGGIYIWKPLFEEHFPRRKKTSDTPDPSLVNAEPELESK